MHFIQKVIGLIFISLFIFGINSNAQNNTKTKFDTLYVLTGKLVSKKDSILSSKGEVQNSYILARDLQKDNWDEYLKWGAILISFLGTLFTIVKGIDESKKNRLWKMKEFEWKKLEFDSKQIEYNWKRSEFLSKEITAFFSDSNVKRAYIMLDWNEFPMTFSDFELKAFNTQQNYFVFNDNIFKTALMHHKDKEEGVDFIDGETAIRLVMDDFLFRLTMFEQYISRGLIEFEDIKPYLRYTANLMCDTNEDNRRKDVSTLYQLWDYIIKYDNNEVVSLLKRYGYDIRKR